MSNMGYSVKLDICSVRSAQCCMQQTEPRLAGHLLTHLKVRDTGEVAVPFCEITKG